MVAKSLWTTCVGCLITLFAGASLASGAIDLVENVSSGEVTTTGGAFVVRWKTNPSPMPTNEMFDLLVEVRPRDGGKLDAIWLRADAQMPEHNHGMNTQPRTEPLGNGIFAVKGLIFHMSGNWDLVFDVALGAVHEQAMVHLALE
jgi:hypothetical protein